MSADSEQQEPNQQTDFDSLFILNEEDKADLVAKQQQISYIRRGEGGSGAGSPARGSPARRTQGGGSCKHPPGVSNVLGAGVRHSHSMRDQTSHMREKYQQHRRLSIRTPNGSNNNTPKPSGSRNNSLTVNDVEITRQFLATNNKVINRGDSFRRRERGGTGPGTPRRQDSPAHAQTGGGGSHRGSGAGLAGGVEIRVTSEPGPRTRDTDRCFRVVFLGGREVGKTSIVDQFMSSEHADVYENNNEEREDSHDNKERLLTVDVNGVLTQLSLTEVQLDSMDGLASSLDTTVEEYNPDCFILVYAVDDKDSFVLTRDTLACLADNALLAGKKCIVVGAKSDLARTRVVSPGEGCSLAMAQGVKFTEISAGVGCNIDTLLVGIVLQCRLGVSGSAQMSGAKMMGGGVTGGGAGGGGLMATITNVFSKVLGANSGEMRKQCMNLQI